MSTSQNQRRRGRSVVSGVAAAREATPGSSSGSDALAGLRQAVADLDPGAFARCFSPGGWVRVPRPEGDVVRRGPDEIEQLGHELRRLLVDLTWTPSQRFVAAGQVVEEAVARARTVPGAGGWGPASGTPDAGIRVSMRVVAALDPAGGIGSLTVWVDWAALHDPLGVDSARGAASALVAQARARDSRGLRVIESEPGTAPLPVPSVPVQRTPGPPRPPAAVLWWKQHRATLAGSVMALAAAGVIGWVAVTALRPIVDPRLGADTAGPTPTARSSVLGAQDGPGTDSGREKGAAAGPGTSPGTASDLPVITKEKPRAKPTVQAGQAYVLKADLLFETGSTQLTDSARSRLQRMADTIRAKQVTGSIQVNGYTDDVGTSAANLQLSRDRAEAVAEALRQELSGVPLELRPQGFGEPQFPVTTPDGRQQNRKVIIVLPDPEKPASPSPGS